MGFLVTVAVLVSAPPSGGAQARLDEATASIVAAERARGAEVIEDPDALVAAGWTAEKNLAFFAEGARLVSEGRRALERVELEKAEQLLARAEKVYWPEVKRPGARSEWAEAAKWHGVALFELKQTEEARRAWARAKGLLPETPLTEAMVRPDVARAFATVAPTEVRTDLAPPRPQGAPGPGAMSMRTLGIDEIVEAAIAIDLGVLTYAATRVRTECATEVITGTRVDELLRRLDEAPCRSETRPAVLEAEVIVRPRAAPMAGKGGRMVERVPVWRKPWLWVGVVGSVAVGVVLGVSLWPRDATYSAALDFHSFALGAR